MPGMTTRRIFDDEFYAYFVTSSCHRRRRLLDLDHPKRIVLGVLSQELPARRCRVLGSVVMPDDVHAPIWSSRPEFLSRFMHQWKRYSSRRIVNGYRQQDQFKQADFGDRFWQPKYHAFEFFTRPKLEEKLAYMHLNQVRTGVGATRLLVALEFGPLVS
ncbi:MAG: transposase [Pirellulales bacterium]